MKGRDKMFLFSQRKKLAEKFEEFAEKNNLEASPMNLISYLSTKGLIDEKKAIEKLKYEEKLTAGPFIWTPFNFQEQGVSNSINPHLVKIEPLEGQGLCDYVRANYPLIRSITVNEKEKIVTVVFQGGDVRMQKCSAKDEFDPYIGVALCVAQHTFGSKTKFKKQVRKLTDKQFKWGK